MNIERAYIKSYTEKISCEIAEKQDEMIMCAVEQIGGEQYRRITVDKSKVLDALRKATAMKPRRVSLQGWYECPNCRSFLTKGYYCSICGQKINWRNEI